MRPDPNFNPLIAFEATTELPDSWQSYLITNSQPVLYTSDICNILVQETEVNNHTIWYICANSQQDDLLVKFKLPAELFQLLVYAVQNDDEMIFLHQEVGLDIAERDYCYLGGGFSHRDLRVLFCKGTYRILAFPFSYQNKRSAIPEMRSAETLAFIDKHLAAVGIRYQSPIIS